MELNNLVYRSWLNQATAELAAAAAGAVKGEAPEGPDALPRAIGKPAAREVGVGGSTLRRRRIGMALVVIRQVLPYGAIKSGSGGRLLSACQR